MTGESREGAGGPRRIRPPLSPGAQAGVGKTPRGLHLSLPFLPLPQMSESEALISVVNRMVESSSPSAQLFMQVRPLPGSTLPSASFPPPVHGRAAPLPGLTPGLSPAFLLSFLGSPPFFMFVGEPGSFPKPSA